MNRRSSLRIKNKIIKKEEKKLNKEQFIKTLILFRNEQKFIAFPYQNLILDCWVNIFSFLKVAEVLQLSKTNLHMHNIIGQYLCCYLPRKTFYLHLGKIHINYHWFYVPDHHLVPLETQYICSLIINDRNLRRDYDNTFLKNALNFCSLKRLELNTNFSFIIRAHIKKIHHLLEVVETLVLNKCCLSRDCFSYISSTCKNLNKLRMIKCDYGRSMFLEKFINIENFNYISDINNEDIIDDLLFFFDRNQNLKHFGCTANFFWVNHSAFCHSKFEQITLTFTTNCDAEMYEKLFDFLKELHLKGVFKSLNLSFDMRFDILPIWRRILPDFCKIVRIKKLRLTDIDFNGANFLAVVLIHLEEVYTNIENRIAQHLAFIRYSITLKKMTTIYPKCSFPLKYEFFPLNLEAYNAFKFNEERKALANAKPMYWYINEVPYLKLRHTLPTLDLTHIKVRRLANF